MAGEPSLSPEPFVGRDRELAQVDAACRAAVGGRGSLLVVTGEPGIGKTHFCEAAVRRAEAGGLRGVRARCWVDGGSPPLWPWHPILEDLGGTKVADLLAADTGRATLDPDRFARFAAVSDELARVSAEAPICLMIDDVHGADAGTLLLIRFVARSLGRLPIVLLLSRRSGEPAEGQVEAEVFEDLDREGIPIVLPRFDRDEVGRFLDGHGLTGLDDELVVTALRVSDGNPLFLRRIAALGPPGPDGTLPAGLRIAIDQALSRLPPSALHVLRSSAVLGPAPSVTDAAGVTGVEPVAVLDTVSEAAAVGLVATDGPDRFAFSHDLVRSALEETLTPGDRLEVHARAAQLVSDTQGTTPDQMARRAHHALAAAPRSEDDARRAVDACRATARTMAASFAYEQADALLTAAVELHTPSSLGAPPAGLLVEWAEAALRCGHMTEARLRFDRAATRARDEADPALFARAALGLGGHWLNEHRHPVERSRVLGLQRAALQGLPADEACLRARLAARLAAEAVFDGEPVQPVLDALGTTRAVDDPSALAEVLSLTHHALLSVEHTRTRLPLAEELVRVASETGDGLLSLMGLCWRAVDLFHLGDERAHRALEDLRERAQTLACQTILYIVGVMDTMALIRSGRLDAAEEMAHRCHTRGEAAGEVDSFGYLSAHLMTIRWLQGRDAELLEAAEEVTSSPTLIRAEFSMRASAALLTARSGRQARARALLEGMAPDGLATLAPSSSWLPGMAVTVDTAACLGDADLARQAYDLLLPYADLPVMGSVAVVCLGSTERPLGVAAAAFGDLDLAIAHLERAVAANRTLGNQPLQAMSRADLADVLQRRDAPGDRARAAQLYDEAATAADLMGMAVRAGLWRAALAELDDAHDQPSGRQLGADRNGPVPPITSPPAPDRPDGRQGHIHRDGSRWLVAYGGRRVRIGDLVGMRYLAELLTRPGQAVPALTLSGRRPLGGPGTAHEVLDVEARDAYRARIGELTVELAEAEAHNDRGRAQQLRLELDTLVEHLETATGLSGRARRFVDDDERARTAVRKAVKRAIDTIDDADPALAGLLRRTVVTGRTCSYIPDPAEPVVWSTRAPSTDGRSTTAEA